MNTNHDHDHDHDSCYQLLLPDRYYSCDCCVLGADESTGTRLKKARTEALVTANQPSPSPSPSLPPKPKAIPCEQFYPSKASLLSKSLTFAPLFSFFKLDCFAGPLFFFFSSFQATRQRSGTLTNSTTSPSTTREKSLLKIMCLQGGSCGRSSQSSSSPLTSR